MAIHSHELPAVLNPVGDICVQVTIPAHPDYVSLFIRAVRQLENNRLYVRDDVLGADVAIVQAQWRERTVTPLIEALANGHGCGVDGECLAFPPFASFISYYPQNPYTEPDLVPDGFLVPPFYVVKNAASELPSHKNGDVIVALDAVSLELSWDLANTPRIEFCLEGYGVAEIHFLNIIQGGMAVVSVDNPVDLGDIIAGITGDVDIIDLNQDITSLPPETPEEVIIEVEIPEDGEHIVYIYFLPAVNDSLIPLGFGGGIREISLCGNLRPCGTPAPLPPPPLEGVTELKPEFQFTAECGFEYRLRDQEDNIVQDWQAIPGWDENAALCFAVGANMATKEDIRDGMYEAINRVAAQIVSGRYINIGIDEDGNVTDPSLGAGGEELPEDDPSTPAIDESLAARAGGCKFVVEGYNSIWEDMNTWKVAGLTADVISFRLQAKYQMIDDATTDNFVALYFTAYGTGHINSYTSTLAEMLFCGGDSFKSTVGEYIIDSITFELQENAFALNNALSDEQIADWFNRGSRVPSSDYNGYGCTVIEEETVQLDMSTANNPSIVTAGVWKHGHRFLITVSGSYVDSDLTNTVSDAMYEHNTLTGAKTFRPLNFSSSAGVGQPTQINVPFEASHIYQFTVDKADNVANSTCTITADNGPMTIPNVTGILTITIKDLGKFVV